MKSLSLDSVYAAEESVSLPLPVSKAPESFALTTGGGGGEQICLQFHAVPTVRQPVKYIHLSCFHCYLPDTSVSLLTVHDGNAILQQPPTAERPLPRVGLSSEWGGSSRPMSHLLDEGMSRSKVTFSHELESSGPVCKKKGKKNRFNSFLNLCVERKLFLKANSSLSVVPLAECSCKEFKTR